MSIRAQYKDEQYFRSYIEYENTRIDKFMGIFRELQNKENQDFTAISRCRRYLITFTMNKLMAIYSVGEPKEKVYQVYESLMNLITEDTELSYRELLEISSLTILLSDEISHKVLMATLIKKSGFEDDLLFFLMDALVGTSEVRNQSGLMFPHHHHILLNVLWEKDQKKAEEALLTYLEKHWYEGNTDAAWYDAHKSLEDIYFGYWSLESGAIAKIKGLDPLVLSESKYFPEDLVL